MEEKEILTNDTQTNEEEKQAAVAMVANAFISGMEAQARMAAQATTRPSA